MVLTVALGFVARPLLLVLPGRGLRHLLSKWQDEFYAHMKKAFPVPKRGESALVTKRKHIPTFNDGYMYCMRPIQGEDYSETGYMFPLELVTGIATTAALKWTKRLVKSDGEQV